METNNFVRYVGICCTFYFWLKYAVLYINGIDIIVNTYRLSLIALFLKKKIKRGEITEINIYRIIRKQKEYNPFDLHMQSNKIAPPKWGIKDIND